MKFHEIDLKIGEIEDLNGPEVRLLFSRSVRDVRMTPEEAERYGRRMIEVASKIREREGSKNAGIDTGILASQ